MKIARKVRVTRFKMPISAALERVFRRTRKLVLLKKSKAFEIGFEESPATSAVERAEGYNFVVLLREGAAGACGKAKKIRCRQYQLHDIAVRQAMQRLASGWSVENAKIAPAVLERWLAEVKRIGKSRSSDWLTLSERALG
jgi:hypothetical protein